MLLKLSDIGFAPRRRLLCLAATLDGNVCFIATCGRPRHDNAAKQCTNGACALKVYFCVTHTDAPTYCICPTSQVASPAFEQSQLSMTQSSEFELGLLRVLRLCLTIRVVSRSLRVFNASADIAQRKSWRSCSTPASSPI
jgi:hypothetical protein